MHNKLSNILSSRNKKFKIMCKENINLKTSNTKLKIKNDELNWKFENLKKHFNVLNKNNEELSKELSNLIKENENLMHQIQKSNLKNENFDKKITLLKRKINSMPKKNNVPEFINFQEYLAKSYISPIVEAPFVFEYKRVFAFMDHLGKQLRTNTYYSSYKPLISVILHISSDKNIAEKSLISVLDQTYKKYEIIVWGETKEIINLLKDYKDNRIKVFHQNIGNSVSRNDCLKYAKGDIITYLDSYNEWDCRYLETIIGAFIQLPDANALYSGQYLYNPNTSKPYAIRFASFNNSLLHNHNFIDLNCFCHKTDIFNKIKGFDENLEEFSEWDFLLKISNLFKIYSIPILLTRSYNSNLKEEILEIKSDNIKSFKKILNRNRIPTKKYNPLNKHISIIIPNYESLDELKQCINSILTYESKEKLDIIIVDNNSGNKVQKYLMNLESENKIKLILNKINYGFSFAVNQGINLSNEDSDILLLNNDAILTKGSLEHMQFCAYSIPNCGLIVPHEMLCNGDNRISDNVPYAYNDFECDVTPSRLHHNIINMPLFHDGGLLELNFAPFFCTYIKREIYNKTLGLDSELGRHYRSDRIYSDFIRHFLQLKIYQAPHAYVYHRHKVATSYLKEKNKEEYEFIFNKNQWEPNLAKKLGFKKSEWDY